MQSNMNATIFRAQENNIRLRRVRLISDVLEDYQDNMRRALRLIEMDNYYSDDVSREQPRGDNRTPVDDPQPQIHRNPMNDDEYSDGFNTEEIHNATTRFIYDTSMNQTQCPITWEPFVSGQSILQINGCDHMFSTDAIVEWFRRRRHCPVCRARPILYPNRRARVALHNPATTHNMLSLSSSIVLDDEVNIPNEPLPPQRVDISGNHNSSIFRTDVTANNAELPALANTLLNHLIGALRANNERDSEISFNLNDVLNSYSDVLTAELSHALFTSNSRSTTRNANNYAAAPMQ